MNIYSLKKKLLKLRFKDIIYPTILTLFIIITGIAFAFSAKFLSTNLNKIIILDAKSIELQLPAVHLNKFYIIAQKLGINVVTTEAPSTEITTPEIASTTEKETVPQTEVPPAEISTTTEATTTPTEIVVPTLDTSSLKISILNGTNIKGLAATLKTELEKDDFVVEKIGNSTKNIKDTVIQIKPGKKEYLSLLKQAIPVKYVLGPDETLGENNAYDAIIIIGSNTK